MSAGHGFFEKAGAAARKRQIIIAGGGIAGLTAALALEQRGFAVTVFERSATRQIDGAGLQLSPNATRLLAGLKVLPRLKASAVGVETVLLMSGATAAPLLTLDVSDAANRWRAPYLAVHRADLAAALAQEAQTRPAVTVVPGSEVTHYAAHANGVTVSVTGPRGVSEAEGIFLIGADGVWSRMRGELGGAAARDTGHLVYRNMADAGAWLPEALRNLLAKRQVAAFLAPKAHLVAYPVRGGAALNLAAIARSGGKRNGPDLPDEFARLEPELAAFLRGLKDWTQWPIHTLDPSQQWSDGRRLLLIGDAAHAMEPYGAQGAAMAIEDACTIAACLAANRDDPPAAVAIYEKLRRARIKRMAARASANRIAYHAGGIAALARNALFQFRGQKMLNGLDWVYGFDAGAG
jgi:salicylate hydroxylase